MQAAIATYGLSKEFPTCHGVHSISVQVQPGETLGLVGPPGSGKSTLLKLLATRLAATQGSFAILGHRIPTYRPPARALTAIRTAVGSLLEDTPVAGDLTGWENAWLLGRLHGLPRRELERRLQILFDWAGMTAQARHPARTYSYPMRRKLGLIGALLHDPRILLLDEPFHGLDMEGRAALQSALAEIRQKGVTVLIAVGDPLEARGICTRVIVMDGGRVLADGPAGPLLQSLGQWSVIEVILGGLVSGLNLTGVPGLCAPAEMIAGGFRVRVEDPDLALAPLLAYLAGRGSRVLSVAVRRPEAGRRP